jgi:hypothetical protein
MRGRTGLVFAVALTAFLNQVSTSGTHAPVLVAEPRLVLSLRDAPPLERLEVEQTWAKPGTAMKAFGTASLILSDGSSAPLLFTRRTKSDAGDLVYDFRTPLWHRATAAGEVTRAHIRIRLSEVDRTVRRLRAAVSLRGRGYRFLGDPATVSVADKPALSDWILALGGDPREGFATIEVLAPFPDASVLVSGGLSDRVEFGQRPGVWRGKRGEAANYVARIDVDGDVLWVKTIGRDFWEPRWNEVQVITYPDGSSIFIKVQSLTGFLENDDGSTTTIEPPEGCERMSLLVKYSPEGEVQWYRTLAGPGYPWPEVTAVLGLADGSAMLWGAAGGGGPIQFSGSLEDPAAAILSGDGGPAFEVRLNRDGHVDSAQWIGDCKVTGAALCSDGSRVITGECDSQSYLDPPGGSRIALPSRGGIDAFVAFFHQSGGVRWFASMGGSDNDFLLAPVTYGDGAIAIALRTAGSKTAGSRTIEIRGSEESSRVFELPEPEWNGLILSWKADGSLGWTSLLQGCYRFDFGLAGKPGGNLLLCGDATWKTVSLNSGTPQQTDLAPSPGGTIQSFLASWTDAGALADLDVIALARYHGWPLAGPVVAPLGVDRVLVAHAWEHDLTLWPSAERITRLFHRSNYSFSLFTTPCPSLSK